MVDKVRKPKNLVLEKESWRLELKAEDWGGTESEDGQYAVLEVQAEDETAFPSDAHLYRIRKWINDYEAWKEGR